MQNPRVPEVRVAPGGRACPRGMPPSLGFRPRPRGRCVPRFRIGAATCFIVFKNFTAARAARRAPSPPRSRGATVLPFLNFAFICERGAVRTTPLVLSRQTRITLSPPIDRLLLAKMSETNRPIPLYQPKIPWSNNSRTEIIVTLRALRHRLRSPASRKRCLQW